MELTNLQSKWW